MGNIFPHRSTVTAVARTPNNLDLFVLGSDGGVESTYWDASGGWGDWFRIGPEAATFPGGNTVTAVARTPDHLDLFVVANNGGIYSSYWDDGIPWSGDWFRIGPEAATFPGGNAVTAVARTPNNLDLFVLGSDGGVQIDSRLEPVADPKRECTSATKLDLGHALRPRADAVHGGCRGPVRVEVNSKRIRTGSADNS
jgi:hypothetical protein